MIAAKAYDFYNGELYVVSGTTLRRISSDGTLRETFSTPITAIRGIQVISRSEIYIINPFDVYLYDSVNDILRKISGSSTTGHHHRHTPSQYKEHRMNVR